MNDGFLIENAVRNGLKRQSVTQTELAKQLGVCTGTIHDWIVRRHRLPKKTAEKIAEILDVSVSEIFDDAQEPKYLNAAKLAKLRKEKKITEQQIAKRLFLTLNTVSRWMCSGKQKTKCAMPYIQKIADMFGVKPEDLIEEGNNEHRAKNT